LIETILEAYEFPRSSPKFWCKQKHRQTDSSIWSDLLKIKDIYLQGRKITSKNGRGTLFWKDSWLYEKPLHLLYPDLFKLREQPDISVYDVKNNPQLVTFTRWLVDSWRLDWERICADVGEVTLNPGEDVTTWKFGPKGRFTVKPVYE